MAEDKLMFPVGFDVDSGVNDAIKEWNKAQQRLTQAIGNKPIKVQIVTDKNSMTELEQASKKATSTAEQGMKKSGLAADSYKAKLRELTIQWNNLTAAQRGGIEGNKIIAQYKALNAEAKGMTGTISAAAKMQDKQAASTKNATSAIHGQNAAYKTQLGYVDRLVTRLGVYGLIFGGLRMIDNIRSTTAEFELQKVALGAIIQDADKAAQLFAQIKAAAVQSPFEIKDLVSYTKQLAAYRIETEDLFDTTQRLADISAGLGVDMGRLILAYGQVRAASVLRGQELRQFTEAGIPLVDLLAKKFSVLRGEMVSNGEVFELISKKAVSFRMVKEIFEDMTNAGGMFYQMQKKQAQTLAGEWSNLKDALSTAYDEMGRDVYGPMRMGVGLLRALIENWRTVANIVLFAGTTYALIALRTKGIKAEQERLNYLIGKEEALRYKNALATGKQLLEQKKLEELMRKGASDKGGFFAGVGARLKPNTKEIMQASVVLGDLTEEQEKQAASDGKLTKTTAKKAIALGQTTKAQRNAMISTKLLTAEEVKAERQAARTVNGYKLMSNTIYGVGRAFKALGAALVSSLWAMGIAVAIGGIMKLWMASREATQRLDKLKEQVKVYGNELKDAYAGVSETIAKGLAAGASEKDIKVATISLQQIIEKNEALKPLVEARLKNITEEAKKLLAIKQLWDEIVEATGGENSKVERMVELMANARKGTEGWFDEDVVKNAREAQEDINKIGKTLSDLAAKGVYVTDIQKEFEELQESGADTGKIMQWLEETLNRITKQKGQTNELRQGFFTLQAVLKTAQKSLKVVEGDVKQFWDYMFANITEFNGQKIDRTKFNLGLTDENFKKFQTQAALARAEFFKSFDDIEKKGIGVFNYLSSQTIQPNIILFGPGTGQPKQLAGWQVRFNSYISGMSESIVDTFTRSTDNIYETQSDLLEAAVNNYEKYSKDLITVTNKSLDLFEGSTTAERQKNKNAKIAETKKLADEYKKTAKYLGGKVDKTDGEGTDNRLSLLKEEVSLVEKTYAKYKEFLSYLSESDAQKKIAEMFGENGKVKGTRFTLPFTSADIQKIYKDAADAAKSLPKSQRDMLEFGWKADEVSWNDFVDDLKQKLDKLSTEIERQQAASNFYEKMLGLTGDRQLAMTLTMSVYGDMGEGLAETIQKQWETAFNAVNLSAAIKDKVEFADLLKDGKLDLSSVFIDGVPDLSKLKQLYDIINKGTGGLKEQKKVLLDLFKDTAKIQEQVITDLISTYTKFEDFTSRESKIKNKAESDRKIAKEYIKDAKQLQNTQDGINKWEINELAKLEIERFKAGEAYAKTYKKMENVSSESIREIIEGLKKLAEQEGLTFEQRKQLIDEIQKYEDTLVQRDPFGAISKGLQDFQKANTAVIAARKALAEAQKSGDPDEIKAKEKDLNDAYEARIEPINKIKDGFVSLGEAITQVSNLMKQVVDWLGIAEDSDAGIVFNEFGKSLTFVATAIGIAAAAWGIYSTFVIGATEATAAFMTVAFPLLIAAAAIAAVFAVFNIVQANKVKRANREIERQQKILDSLSYTYGRLQKAAEDALGVDYIQNYNQQLDNLADQQIATQKQLQAEKDKGKKADQKAIEDYEKQIRELKDQQEDMKKAFAAGIAGTDITSLAKELVSVWIEARKAGEDTMSALGKKYKDLMKEIAANTLLNKAMQVILKPVFDQLDELREDSNKMYDQLWWQNLDKVMNEAMINGDVAMENIYKMLQKFGINMRDTSGNLSGISKEIAGASEEAILGLAAGINTQNFYISGMYNIQTEILNIMRQSSISGGGQSLTDVLTLQNTYFQNLPKIEANTAQTVAECRLILAEVKRSADNFDRVVKPIGVKGGYAVNTQLN